ncbi:MAG: hypothetical protein LBU38_07095 [Propionibacteriaceae bacterium]|jgi:acyl dehydratase|nr:hypothetical protein [Propionibacteriaceae bacterium]
MKKSLVSATLPFQVRQADVTDFADLLQTPKPADLAAVSSPVFAAVAFWPAIKQLLANGKTAWDFPGTLLAAQSFSFHRPIIVGESFIVQAAVERQNERGGMRLLQISCQLSNANGEMAVTGLSDFARSTTIPTLEAFSSADTCAPVVSGQTQDGLQSPNSLSFHITPDALARFCELVGDNNPIHFSDRCSLAGFESPIAPGLLTLGIALRTLSDNPDFSKRIRAIQARFASPVVVPPAGAQLFCHATAEPIGNGTTVFALGAQVGGSRVLANAKALLAG